jgi:hypothetical protein
MRKKAGTEDQVPAFVELAVLSAATRRSFFSFFVLLH